MQRNSIFRATFLLSITWVLFTFTNSNGQASQKTEKPGTNTISGRVINESGQGQPNVRVFLFATRGPQIREAVATDDSGKFVFEGLARGMYTISAQSPGYVSSRDPDAPAHNRPGDSVTLILRKG